MRLDRDLLLPKMYQRTMYSYLVWSCLQPISMKAITLNTESTLCTMATENLKFPKFETRESASVELPVRFQSFKVTFYRAVCSFYPHYILYKYLRIYLQNKHNNISAYFKENNRLNFLECSCLVSKFLGKTQKL